MCEIKHIKSKDMFPVIKEILKQGSKAQITVTGMSMYPFLRGNIDRVEIAGTSFDMIFSGDIIIAQRYTGEYVMHRVIKKEGHHFYMVGDAQQRIEGPLYPDQLVGIITAVWRRDNKIECGNLWWMFLSKLWLRILPCRYLIIGFYRGLRQVLQRLVSA